MKILIVRFSSIGDIVLTTPVVRAISRQLHDSEIHYLTKKRYASIVYPNPHVVKVHTIEKSVDEVLEELKMEHFDMIVDLHHNLRTTGLKSKLKRPAVTFRKLNWKKWLLVRFKMNRLPDVHVVDRYFEAVKPLGVENDGFPGEFYIPKQEEVDVTAEFGLAPKEYIAIAIGAQFNTKRMPASLVSKVIDDLKSPYVLLGGEGDQTLSAEILQLTDKPGHDACGKFSLAQSASIARQSKKLLTNDTGLMHIAACFDVPIVSVWGNTVPAFGMYPYYPGHPEKYHIHEVSNLSCRPCSKIGHQSCPKGHFRCMKEQDAGAIAKNLEA